MSDQANKGAAAAAGKPAPGKKAEDKKKDDSGLPEEELVSEPS
jgi:hypothetical protein